ncbi:MAG: 2-octaprenyl-6-methoxyphenyl hydroxylase [Legionella sp.]|nr:2-octaprenyl-6-methoxyphenyl hydroxylase [Legionella sp.]
MNKQVVDVLIIGGGLTGATLMLALQQLGLQTLLVDKYPLNTKTQPEFDARSLALSPASRNIFQTLEIWELLAPFATPIEMIHVSEQRQFGVSRLQGTQDMPLGYVVEVQHLNRVLHEALNKKHVLAPASVTEVINASQVRISFDNEERVIQARLIVAADGTHSTLRQFYNLPSVTKIYLQQAIVTNVGIERPHDGCAYERFTAQGPLALLPLQGKRMSLVWSVAPQQAEHLLNQSETQFLQELQQNFGFRLGRFTQMGTRSTFKLQQVIMPQQTKDSVVFIGNAAHTLHPVAGQGFNLGLRDVATLIQCISQFGLSPDMLQQYTRMRIQDQKIITYFTDGLINLFSNRLPGLGVLRGLGLAALDNINPLKKLLARYAGGFAGVIPDLVCGIGLHQIANKEKTNERL